MGKIIYNQKIKETLDSILLKFPGVNPGKMFGYPAYYIGKKLFACVYGDGVGIKVSEELAEELIGTENVIHFRPMGRARMRQWIQINRQDPADYHNDMDIFKAAMDFVSKNLD